jgi:hypothetical protein
MPPRKNKRNQKQEDEENQKKELDEEKKKKEKEEDEEKKKDEEKNRIANFAKVLEEQLVIALTTDNTIIKITHHTFVILDDVWVDIFVGKEKNKYSYYITNCKLTPSNKIDDEDDSDNDIKFLEKEDFPTLVKLLTDLEEVKKTYRFIEHKLVSPSEYEFAKNQRIFFPISSDKSCPICYDSTIEYTTCNHPICFKCRMKCVLSEKNACPLCRETNLSIFPQTLTYILTD